MNIKRIIRSWNISKKKRKEKAVASIFERIGTHAEYFYVNDIKKKDSETKSAVFYESTKNGTRYNSIRSCL